jgi:hypothetical protein
MRFVIVGESPCSMAPGATSLRFSLLFCRMTLHSCCLFHTTPDMRKSPFLRVLGYPNFGFSLRTSQKFSAPFAVKVFFFTQTQKPLTAKIAKRSRKARKVNRSKSFYSPRRTGNHGESVKHGESAKQCPGFGFLADFAEVLCVLCG